VPAGTQVALNLVSPIKSKSTKPGDTVRALVAFPVTAGEQIAIPQGTFAEGQLVQTQWPKGTKSKATKGKSPLQIHFTRLVFANGYTVPMDGMNLSLNSVQSADGTELAMNEPPALPVAPVMHGPSPLDPLLEGKGQFPSPPQQTSVKMPGPNPVAVTLGTLGGAALLFLGLALIMHHANKNVDFLLYDAGWQFSMTLNQPLLLDRAQVKEAATIMVPAQ
jgi:hypothetical protein